MRGGADSASAGPHDRAQVVHGPPAGRAGIDPRSHPAVRSQGRLPPAPLVVAAVHSRPAAGIEIAGDDDADRLDPAGHVTDGVEAALGEDLVILRMRLPPRCVPARLLDAEELEPLIILVVPSCHRREVGPPAPRQARRGAAAPFRTPTATATVRGRAAAAAALAARSAPGFATATATAPPPAPAFGRVVVTARGRLVATTGLGVGWTRGRPDSVPRGQRLVVAASGRRLPPLAGLAARAGLPRLSAGSASTSAATTPSPPWPLAVLAFAVAAVGRRYAGAAIRPREQIRGECIGGRGLPGRTVTIVRFGPPPSCRLVAAGTLRRPPLGSLARFTVRRLRQPVIVTSATAAAAATAPPPPAATIAPIFSGCLVSIAMLAFGRDP